MERDGIHYLFRIVQTIRMLGVCTFNAKLVVRTCIARNDVDDCIKEDKERMTKTMTANGGCIPIKHV